MVKGPGFVSYRERLRKPGQLSLVKSRLTTSNLLYQQHGFPALSKYIVIETIQEEIRHDKYMKCHSNLEKLNLRTLNW